jgi:anti-anti-sigma factor
MQLSLEQSHDVHIVRVGEDKLTYPVLSPFFAEVRRLVDDGARKVVIDLQAVAFIDSASIGCLTDIHRLLRDRNGAVKLSGLQRRVETMLLLVGLDRVLDFRGQVSEAVAAFEREKVV